MYQGIARRASRPHASNCSAKTWNSGSFLIGVTGNSPFGPFRIDLAYPLLKAEGDDTRFFTFNVGTAF